MRQSKIVYMLLTAVMISSFTTNENAAASPTTKASSVSIGGTISGGSGYTIQLVSRAGLARSILLPASGKFNFSKIATSFAKNATLQLIAPNGSYFGPIVLASKGTKAFVGLSGKLAKGEKSVKLGKIQLNTGFAKLKKAPSATNYAKSVFATADSSGAPLGAGNGGYTLLTTAGIKGINKRAVSDELGGDPDSDGIPSAYDSDDDGDLVLDATDTDTASTTAASNPFTTLYLGIAQSINQNIGSGLTSAAIDAVISGENLFNLILFISLPPDSTVNGGHVICGSGLTYCAQSIGSAIYGGVSESSNDLRGQRWTDINTNGSGYPNLEHIPGRSALVAGIQPRIGTSSFRERDAYQVVFTSGGTTTETRPMVLSPYFVSVPAMSVYDAGSGNTTVDYSSGSVVGNSSSNPINLTSEGTITIRFWRPQRVGISGVDSVSYMDMGHLNYGVIVGGLSSEFTCGGLYSNLEGLTESSSLGAGGSVFAQDGANLWPLVDASSDAAPAVERTLAFTVDLKSCLTRGGATLGANFITLTAAGVTLAGGANRAAQNFYVTVN